MTHLIPNIPFKIASGTLLVWLIASLFVVMPVQLSTMLISICLVYIGSYISIFTKKDDQMTKGDAATFPLIASATLLGLYAAFKFFNEDIMKELIFIYLVIAAGLSMAGCINMVKENRFGRILYTIDIKKFIKFHYEIRVCDLISYPIAIVFCCFYYFKTFWIGNNILGICIALIAMAYESLGSFKTGVYLMAGLFLYDIFWVFGTEVMVKVAVGVKGPIKFIFPKALPAPTEYTREYFSMLGLGDVVVPGFFIAFLLAFDAYNARKSNIDTLTTKDWKKPYFHTCCVFYAIALLLTVVVMLWFKHAQPALLYIVPCCFISAFGTALYKGQLRELWNYSEEEIKTKYSKKND